jgi:hypothetical protein
LFTLTKLNAFIDFSILRTFTFNLGSKALLTI